MKTNYEIRYAAHPEDAKSYDTQRIRRDFYYLMRPSC